MNFPSLSFFNPETLPSIQQNLQPHSIERKTLFELVDPNYLIMEANRHQRKYVLASKGICAHLGIDMNETIKGKIQKRFEYLISEEQKKGTSRAKKLPESNKPPILHFGNTIFDTSTLIEVTEPPTKRRRYGVSPILSLDKEVPESREISSQFESDNLKSLLKTLDGNNYLDAVVCLLFSTENPFKLLISLFSSSWISFPTTTFLVWTHH